MSESTESERGTATRVVVSFPPDLSDWGRKQLDARHFRAYLRRAHGRAEPGDVWEEFLDVGCCGDSLDVTLRVEAVGGGPEMDEETGIEYVEGETGSVEGGWRVQSAEGP